MNSIKIAAVFIAAIVTAWLVERTYQAWRKGKALPSRVAFARMRHARMLALQPGAGAVLDPLWDQVQSALNFDGEICVEGTSQNYLKVRYELYRQAAKITQRFAVIDTAFRIVAQDYRSKAVEAARLLQETQPRRFVTLFG